MATITTNNSNPNPNSNNNNNNTEKNTNGSSLSKALQQPNLSNYKQVPNYFSPAFVPPPSSSSATTVSSSSAAFQNPLLSNGVSTSSFQLPSLAALRPPSNFNLPSSTIPKLTNFNPLQPPPTITTNFNSTLSQPTLSTTLPSHLQQRPLNTSNSASSDNKTSNLNAQLTNITTNTLLNTSTLQPPRFTQPTIQTTQSNLPVGQSIYQNLVPSSEQTNIYKNTLKPNLIGQLTSITPPIGNQAKQNSNNETKLPPFSATASPNLLNLNQSRTQTPIQQNQETSSPQIVQPVVETQSQQLFNDIETQKPTTNIQTYESSQESSSHDDSDVNQSSSINDTNQSLSTSGTSSATTKSSDTTTSLHSNDQKTSNFNIQSSTPSNNSSNTLSQINMSTNTQSTNFFQQPQLSQPPINTFTSLQQQQQQQRYTPQPTTTPNPPFFNPSNINNQAPGTAPPLQSQSNSNQLPATSAFTPLINTGQQVQGPRFGTITGPPQQNQQSSLPSTPQPQFFSPTPIRPPNTQSFGAPPTSQNLIQPPLIQGPPLSQGPPLQPTNQPIFQPNMTRPQFGPPLPTTNTSQPVTTQPLQTPQPPPIFPQLGAQVTSPPLGAQGKSPFSSKYPTPTTTGQTINDPTKTNNAFPTNSSRPSSTLPPPSTNQLTNQMGNMSIKGQKPLAVDLLREKRLLPSYDDNTELVRPKFPHEFYTNVNCHPEIIRSTLTSIPENSNLLSKCRLPLGLLIHPFKDLESLKVVQSSTIVRCRNCRSYINPFVHFLDNTKWRCNLCYSVNDLPDEFLFDPVTRTYGDPSKRPEINSSTIEFIAPAEYTLRPPPPAMYLFLLDVSHNAINTGYLQNACEILLECLDKLPGDTRTQIGFITYNSCIQFYNLSDSLSQPQMMVYPDIDDVVLPLPENLMINLIENKETIQTFLQDLPNIFQDTYDTESALGTALTAAFKLLTATGGRVTIMQTCLPTCGVGSLKQRNDSIEKDGNSLGPQTDFYKKLALECAVVHIAVDLFMFNALYADIATLSCISKYSGGEVKYYPEFHLERYPEQSDRFCYDFKRYLTRKIGFEAVMRIRCTRGLSIHTFHGNFFVRSTDLLALPNVNPDAGFGMQVSIDESLSEVSTVCFQAALLYTSSKGERRIRIHTYCLPISNNVNELINGADQEAIIGLVSKMAVDRSVMHSVKEAKDALANVAIDYLSAYTQVVTKNQRGSLLSPYSLRLVPLYILALMKNISFKYGNIKMDDRVYAMNVLKTQPLKYLLLYLYPNLYPVHNINDSKTIIDSDTEICIPPRLHLSSESIDRHGVYILDVCETIYMWIGRSVNDQFLQQVFNVKTFNELPDHGSELPELDNALSERIRNFIVYLYDQRPFGASFIYFREDSSKSHLFFQHIHEDKTESTVSYVEFIRYLNDQVNNN